MKGRNEFHKLTFFQRAHSNIDSEQGSRGANFVLLENLLNRVPSACDFSVNSLAVHFLLMFYIFHKGQIRVHRTSPV